MDIPFLFKLVKMAIERQNEDRLHDQYCALMPYMDEKSFKPFSEWKIPYMSHDVYYENKSTDEIMRELKGGVT